MRNKKPYDWEISNYFHSVIYEGPIGSSAPHPEIKYEDEIEMFPEKEFNEFKKKLDIL